MDNMIQINWSRSLGKIFEFKINKNRWEIFLTKIINLSNVKIEIHSCLQSSSIHINPPQAVIQVCLPIPSSKRCFPKIKKRLKKSLTSPRWWRVGSHWSAKRSCLCHLWWKEAGWQGQSGRNENQGSSRVSCFWVSLDWRRVLDYWSFFRS